MSVAYFITHPEVFVDPSKPVPQWHLSDQGVQRMRNFASRSDLGHLSAIWASTETKAIEAAGILAGHFGLPVNVHHGLHENDRSATGFLPPPEFDRVADTFFANPQESVLGWERAVDAQARVAATVDEILQGFKGANIAFVSHGGVGTLLLCDYLKTPISRDLDQPFQGHFWAFEGTSRRVIHQWREIASRDHK
ncbi:histidine phosphatase family protein [Microvirga sp. BSC39]|uniref:histidine phosphatase family protein n=1 Tax=Microvirga sp. BSC39 TaxID=1549810 RepID=UPI0004E86371|nr:histidine phosphatase family protein [Microvirga sp. BSC39]KFG70793.1 phosphoglycerate mutase [Microvirga sp. BSC39]